MGGIANTKAVAAIAHRLRTHGGAPGILGSLRKYPVTIKSCSVCGCSFVAKGARGADRHICSRACQHEHLRRYKTKNPLNWRDCKHCGANFYARSKGDRPMARFCSKECMYKGKGRLPFVSVPCSTCGKEIVRRQSRPQNNSYCGYDCMAAGKIREAPKTNKAGSVRVWFSRYGRMSECEECGYDDVPSILVLHHKDRDRTNNDLGNLQVLCPNCHAIEHLSENKEGWKHKSTRLYSRTKRIVDETQVS